MIRSRYLVKARVSMEQGLPGCRTFLTPPSVYAMTLAMGVVCILSPNGRASVALTLWERVMTPFIAGMVYIALAIWAVDAVVSGPSSAFAAPRLVYGGRAPLVFIPAVTAGPEFAQSRLLPGGSTGERSRDTLTLNGYRCKRSCSAEAQPIWSRMAYRIGAQSTQRARSRLPPTASRQA